MSPTPADLNPRTDPPLDFRDAPFGALSADDYAALGFLAGLEVHQQLATRTKLFCRCPAGRYTERYDAEVLRHMRPTLSELGEYDGTALMEFKTKKEIVYRLERGTVCTYEIDDTPPFAIDQEAVGIAIELAELLGLNLVSELHVMRKQYLDGSIPTGFQRTAMVGLDGAMPFVVPELGVKRDLGIRQLSLEEDSCREVSDVGHRIIFRTDRLGVPLSETVTEPELLSPLEVREAGRLIAQVAHATGKVRRGAGAARQDVNVSVAGGRRVEIKGVSHHLGLPPLVHIEALRQLNLLRIKAELVRRGVTMDMLHPVQVTDAAPALRATTSRPIQEALDRGHHLRAVRLPGFAGLLAHATQPDYTFAHELAERVRVIACPVHRPFLFHSDEPRAGVFQGTWRELRRQLGADNGDAVVLVWGEPEDAATAANEVVQRARDAVEGVPAETRQAHRDGTTGFERILPGPDRMYPDTDTPPLPITDALVARLRSTMPERPWERAARYERLGLDARAAVRLARASWADTFDAAAPAHAASARRLAGVLERRAPYYARRGLVLPSGERIAPFVRALESGSVRPEALPRMLDRLVGSAAQPEAIVAQFGGDTNGATLASVIRDVIASLDECRSDDPDARLRWAMGRAMSQLLGRVAPTEVWAVLSDALAAVEVAP